MSEAECVICRDVITQPICGKCLEVEMVDWLQEQRPDLIDEVRQRIEELWFPVGDVNCLLCKIPMDVCAYCYTNHVLDWLEAHPELIPEFVTFFNFDLHYDGYGRELLELV